MEKTKTQSPLTGPWPAFIAAAVTGLGLCWWGGRFGYIGVHAYRFMTLWALTWAIMFILVLLYPRKQGFWFSLILICLLALAARTLLLPHPPSTDINRYLWEGRVAASGFSPYTLAPLSPDLIPLRDDLVWPRINQPAYTAIYPPLMTIGFSFVARIWYSPLAMKWVIILFDMGTLALLITLLNQRRLPIRYGFLYAFNPVILYAFSAHGHLDAVQIFFLTAAWLAHFNKRHAWMFLCLGLAVQAKYAAIVVLPFLLNRSNWKYAWISIITILLPFAWFLPSDGTAIFDSLRSFGLDMSYNGLAHGLIRRMTGNKQVATYICGGLLATSLAYALVRLHPGRSPKNTVEQSSLFALGALLILSPTMQFWYVAWIIPPAIIRMNRAWLVFCLSLAFFFLVYHNSYYHGLWDLPGWAIPAQWLPLWAVLVWDSARGYKRLNRGGVWEQPAGVSVVIPTLNEASELDGCLSAIRRDPVVTEIIVVDAGSKDDTRALAQNLGARVIDHSLPVGQGGGRGAQIRKGVEAAGGDVVAVVHADTRPDAGVFDRMIETLSHNPDIVGGAAGSRFTQIQSQTRPVEIANDLRAFFFDVSFGDQIQFFRRKPLVETGLTPDQPLMEDVELSLRLGGLGNTVYLWSDSRVSPRKWQQKAFSRAVLILKLVGLYMLHRLYGKPDTTAMYNEYYGLLPTKENERDLL